MSAVPAYAEGSEGDELNTATTVATENQESGGSTVQMGDLAARYAELSAGLLGAGAGVNIGFGGGTLEEFAKKVGVEGRSELLAGGFAYQLDTTSFSSLSEYAQKFWADGGVNGKVAAAGALYATQLGSLKVPELSVSSFDAPEIIVPEEALLFGLVYDKSITTLVQSGVLEEVQSNFSSSEFMESFSAAMQTATKATEATLSEKLISPCHGAFLAAMGGGMKSVGDLQFSPDCSACAAGGLYMHHEMNRLLDKSFDLTYFDPNDDTLDPKEYGELIEWLKPIYEDQDPVRIPRLNSGRGDRTSLGAAYDCNASAQAGARSLKEVLEDTTNRLSQHQSHTID